MFKNTPTLGMEPEVGLKDSKGTVPLGEVPRARSVVDQYRVLGGQRMLQAVAEIEVTNILKKQADERDDSERRLVVHDSHL